MVNPIEVVKQATARLEVAWKMQHPEGLPYEAGVLGGEQRTAARRMRAQIYLERGYIAEDDIDSNTGTISRELDHYDDHSIEFGVWDKDNPDDLLMSMRLILAKGPHDAESFQIHFEDLPDEHLRQRYLGDDANLEAIAELGGFVKKPGLDKATSGITVQYLLREMVRTSDRIGVKEWVFGMKPKMLKRYKAFFGDALEPLSNEPVRFGNYAGEYMPHRIDTEAAYWRFLGAVSRKLGLRAIARFWEEAKTQAPDDPAPVSPAVAPTFIPLRSVQRNSRRIRLAQSARQGLANVN
jgi:hypothetical protein